MVCIFRVWTPFVLLIGVAGKHVVFGKVVRGFEDVVQKLASVPVDAKDRPQVPVEIHNCGELELRRKPEESKKGEVPLLPGFTCLSNLHAATVTEDLRSGSDDEREAARRRKHRSDSPDEDSSRRRRKKSKRRKSVSATPADIIRIDRGGPAPETEEEYDERLEREENERREQERQKQLERIKQQYTDSAQTTEGVRFKGMLSVCV